MWSIEKGKEQSVNEKARFEITKKKNWIGSGYRWTNPVTMDRYAHASPVMSSILRPVFYSLKSRNVTMANY